MALREFSGNAKQTTLASEMTNASTSFSVADATGYPTGATAPFVVALDLGGTGEEKVLVTSRSGNTFTIGQRGFDGTSASTHGSGAAVAHVLDATTIRENNAHSSSPHVDLTAWNTYVPSFFGSFAYGPSGAAVARYKQVGKTVMLQVAIDTGTSPNYIGNFAVSLPVASGPTSGRQRLSVDYARGSDGLRFLGFADITGANQTGCFLYAPASLSSTNMQAVNGGSVAGSALATAGGIGLITIFGTYECA